MGTLRNITIALLLVSITGIPAMACLTPAQPMTAAEHECCRRMSHECSSMMGMAEHSCCKVQASPSFPFVGGGHFTIPTPTAIVSAVPVSEALVSPCVTDADIAALSHSPPITNSDVLRI